MVCTITIYTLFYKKHFYKLKVVKILATCKQKYSVFSLQLQARRFHSQNHFHIWSMPEKYCISTQKKIDYDNVLRRQFQISIISTQVVPLYWSNKWTYGHFACKLIKGALEMGSLLSSGFFQLIAVERYLLIVQTLKMRNFHYRYAITMGGFSHQHVIFP